MLFKKKKSIISDWSLCWIKCYFISNKWYKQLFALQNDTYDTAAHYSVITIAEKYDINDEQNYDTNVTDKSFIIIMNFINFTCVHY